MAIHEVIRDAPHLPQLPVDPDVKVPDSVRRAAERANSHYGPAPGDTPAQPDPAVVDASAQPDPAVATPTAPAVPTSPPPPAPLPAPAEPVSPEQWEHRYNSMKGRYDATQRTIGEMQETISQLGDELVRTQQVLRAPRAPAPGNTPPAPLLTPQDEEDYGKPLIDFAQRAALAAVAPKMTELENRNQELSQRLARSALTDMRADVTASVPNWREINRNPRFLAWLRLPDIYSGDVRQALLNRATQAADAPRVIAFFKGFLAEEEATGQSLAPQPEPPVAPRTPAIRLDSLTAPGKARPAGGNSAQSVDKPVFTRAQIAAFYADVRASRYAGREVDKDKLEREIFAAQADGRVR